MFLFLFDVKRVRAVDGSFSPLFLIAFVYFWRVVAVFCVLDFIFAIHI